MKDRINQEISIGSTVLTTHSEYKELLKGKIVRFTPKMVIVSYLRNWGASSTDEEVKRGPSQVVVIDSLINQ